jgi:hypothetical protein
VSLGTFTFSTRKESLAPACACSTWRLWRLWLWRPAAAAVQPMSAAAADTGGWGCGRRGCRRLRGRGCGVGLWIEWGGCGATEPAGNGARLWAVDQRLLLTGII